jgi:hypothetical protein
MFLNPIIINFIFQLLDLRVHPIYAMIGVNKIGLLHYLILVNPTLIERKNVEKNYYKNTEP